jgi:hypothetical protein
MAWWKFWEKKPPGLDNIDWPKDACASAQILAGLFLEQTVPFAEWHLPETVVPENLTGTIRFAVNGVQLSVYFMVIAKNLGKQATRMSRDEFTMTIGKAMESEEMGQMIDSLLTMSEETLLVAGSENKVHLKDRDVEIPVDYYPLAVFFLVCMQDAPFYREKDPQFNDADILTAECIEHGRQRALDLLVPMAQAAHFDPESFTQWRWSEKPAAFANSKDGITTHCCLPRLIPS